MAGIEHMQFLDERRLLLQDQAAWKIVTWPGSVPIEEGQGRAIVAAGKIITSVDRKDFKLDGLPLPMELPIRSYHYVPGHDILVVTGKSALNPGYTPGPSLLPLPPKGPTAQVFQSYPEEGPSLWSISSEEESPHCLFRANGIEEIRRPQYLGPNAIVFEHFHFPVYGQASWLRLRTIDRATLQSEDLLPHLAGITTHLVLSPDPRRPYAAFLHSALEPGTYPYWYRLAVRLGDGAVVHPLPPSVRLTGDAPAWSLDGRWLAMTAFSGIHVGVIRLAVPENPTLPWDWDFLSQIPGTCRLPSVHPDGTVVTLWQTPDRPPTLLPLSLPVPSTVPLSIPKSQGSLAYRPIKWTHGGHTLEGIYVRPAGVKTLPLIVDVHGGPINSLRYERQPRLEQWCRRGFAAFAPDYRGSGILGQQEMLRTFMGDPEATRDECEDILSGVDWLVANGLAQEDQLLLFGHSAGATLINQLITHTTRFNAGASWEGHYDASLGYYLAWGGGGLAFVRPHYGATPTENPDLYRRQSPLARIDQIATPMLLLHGDHQTADPIQWHTLLREAGVATELVFYRNEGHTMKQPENYQDILDRTVQWFSRWLSYHPTNDNEPN